MAWLSRITLNHSKCHAHFHAMPMDSFHFSLLSRPDSITIISFRDPTCKREKNDRRTLIWFSPSNLRSSICDLRDYFKRASLFPKWPSAAVDDLSLGHRLGFYLITRRNFDRPWPHFDPLTQYDPLCSVLTFRLISSFYDRWWGRRRHEIESRRNR